MRSARDLLLFVIGFGAVGVAVGATSDPIMAQQEPGCCHGWLGLSDPQWERVQYSHTYQSCDTKWNAIYYYDAYALVIPTGSPRRVEFSTCGYILGPCPRVPLNEGGAHTSLALYRAPFYDDFPCWNLIDYSGGSCGTLSTDLEPGSYVLVVSATDSELRPSGSGYYNLSYNFPPVAHPPPGQTEPQFSCSQLYSTPAMEYSACAGYLDAADSPWPSGRPRVINDSCFADQGDYRYDEMLDIHVTQPSPWTFSLCQGLPWRTSLSLYRSAWDPADPCDDDYLVASVFYGKHCTQKSEIIGVALDPGNYVLVLSSRSNYEPLPKRAIAYIERPEGSGVITCSQADCGDCNNPASIFNQEIDPAIISSGGMTWDMQDIVADGPSFYMQEVQDAIEAWNNASASIDVFGNQVVAGQVKLKAVNYCEKVQLGMDYGTEGMMYSHQTKAVTGSDGCPRVQMRAAEIAVVDRDYMDECWLNRWICALPCWDYLSAGEVQHLFAHELGHVVFGVGHADDADRRAPPDNLCSGGSLMCAHAPSLQAPTTADKAALRCLYE